MGAGSGKGITVCTGDAGDASSLAEEEKFGGLTGAESNVFPGGKEKVTVA